MAWKRLKECGLCGSARCVQNPSNPRMCYCFRYGKTYFLSNCKPDKVKVKGGCNINQGFLDFGDYEKHMGAVEL